MMNKKKPFIVTFSAILIVLLAVLLFFAMSDGSLTAQTSGVVFSETTGCPATDVPLETQLRWIINITIVNNGPFDVKNVNVTDVFGEAFELQLGVNLTDHYVPEPNPSQGVVQFSHVGNSGNMTLSWSIDTLSKNGGNATLFVFVLTKTNSAGQQEFTVGGTHYLNAGAVATWLDDQGNEGSSTASPIFVTTV